MAINSLTHDGLVDMAIKSAENYDKAQSVEMNILNEVYSIVKETVKKLEDSTINPNPDKPIPTPSPDFTETIELVNNNIGASTDYATPAGRSFSTTIDGIEYSGASKQDFSSDDIALTWKIWEIDDKNIYLISDKATTKQLTLKNYTGYNNGVTLLDNLCNTLYANKEYFPNMTARNLKLSDIANTNVLKDLTSANTKNTNTSYEKTTSFSYNFAYPRVWWDVEQNTPSIEAREKKYNYNNSSLNSYTLLSPNHTHPTPTEPKDSKTPYSTCWINTSMSQKSFRAINGDNGSTLYNLVMGNGIGSSSNKYYWLSSRFVYPYDSTICYFGLQCVFSRGVSYNNTYNYNSSSIYITNMSLAIRPLVQIPLTSCEITQNEDGTFHIAPRG